MPWTGGGIPFELNCKFNRRFGDEMITTLAHHAADTNRVRSQRGRAEFGNLLAYLILRETRAATPVQESENKKEKQLKGPIHQGFESSTL